MAAPAPPSETSRVRQQEWPRRCRRGGPCFSRLVSLGGKGASATTKAAAPGVDANEDETLVRRVMPGQIMATYSDLLAAFRARAARLHPMPRSCCPAIGSSCAGSREGSLPSQQQDRIHRSHAVAHPNTAERKDEVYSVAAERDQLSVVRTKRPHDVVDGGTTPEDRCTRTNALGSGLGGSDVPPCFVTCGHAPRSTARGRLASKRGGAAARERVPAK